MSFCLISPVIQGKPGMVELAFLRDLAEQDNGTQSAAFTSGSMPVRQVTDLVDVSWGSQL